MKLPIATMTSEPTRDDVRRALALNEWLLGAERLRRAGWDVKTDGRRVTGRKFSATRERG